MVRLHQGVVWYLQDPKTKKRELPPSLCQTTPHFLSFILSRSKNTPHLRVEGGDFYYQYGVLL